MTSRHVAEKKEEKSSYEQLKQRLDASIYKEEARQRAIAAKREERRAIKRGGGGKRIAQTILQSNSSHSKHDTDFGFGHNQADSTDEGIDERIAREQAGRCMGQTICNVCGKHHGYCAEIAEDKERLKMLPTGNESTGRSRRNENGIKWLKVENLTTQPKEAKILKVFYNENGRFGARVELKLAFEGDIVYWGVDPAKNSKNPNYKDLTGKFGHDENNWIDQRILLYVEPHPFYESQFNIHVDFPKVKGAK